VGKFIAHGLSFYYEKAVGWSDKSTAFLFWKIQTKPKGGQE